MIKVMALFRAKPGMTREAFIAHYETVHAPMALRLFPMIKAYRRNYVDPSRTIAQNVGFDVITELEFETEADYLAFREKIVLPEVAREIREDEAKFMDSGAARSVVVEPRPA